jgi:leader peptidase (prepilin peptidase)/N-methyltransferase
LESIAFILGLCIGSFLNVCIYRIPASKSIVSPGSTCMSCNQPIRFYDNIPVISYLLLRGRCRYCKTPFSLRYPLIELLSGLFALGVFLRWGLSLESLIYYGFIAVLVVITFIDIDHYIIPDVISLPGIPVGVIASFFLPEMTFKASILGLLMGGGILFAVAWAYEHIAHKEGMGGGDIKLLAMIGAFIGWKGVLVTLFTGSIVGTLAGGVVMIYTRSSLKLKIPFGPFLAIGAMMHIFFGQELLNWYWNGLQ